MLEFSQVKQAASGRWLEILQSLGAPADSLTGRHGPCPGCGGKALMAGEDYRSHLAEEAANKLDCGDG